MNSPTPAPRRRGSFWLAVIYTALTLALCELALRRFRPLPDPFIRLKAGATIAWPGTPYVPSAYPPHHRSLVFPEPGLPGFDTTTRVFSVDNLGYRGDSLRIPKPPGELRIFMVGGSTTECAILDDREAVSRRLQDRLRAALPGVDVRVYGAGKSGDRSWDHVAMTTHRIAHLQPDVVIVFAGINDLMASVEGIDYLLRGDTMPGSRIGAYQQFRMAASELQLVRLAQAAYHGFDPTEVNTHTEMRRLAQHSRTSPLVPLPATDPTPYEENLRTLVGAIRAQGARPVLMTQASTWNSDDPRAARWHWMTGHPRRYPEPALDSALERFNDRTRSVAVRMGVPVLDLARVLPKRMDYFYDDVHFNPAGADRAAELLAQTLITAGVLSRDSAR
jgi:lysophospholipase L1-like esterase